MKRITQAVDRSVAQLLKLNHDCFLTARKHPDQDYTCSRCGEVYGKVNPNAETLPITRGEPSDCLRLVTAMVFARLDG
jgi:hypothetical protein